MNKGESTSRGNKLERKDIEKNRRMRMNALCVNLISLIPPQHFNPPKELLPQPDQLDQAVGYIKNLRERIEELKRKKTELLTLRSSAHATNDHIPIISAGSKLPKLKIRDLGSNLEVVLITELRQNSMLHQIISIIEEEGAEVINASLYNNGDKMFHNIHAQVKVCRLGVDTSRICERIQESISQSRL